MALASNWFPLFHSEYSDSLEFCKPFDLSIRIPFAFGRYFGPRKASRGTCNGFCHPMLTRTLQSSYLVYTSQFCQNSVKYVLIPLSSAVQAFTYKRTSKATSTSHWTKCHFLPRGPSKARYCQPKRSVSIFNLQSDEFYPGISFTTEEWLSY